MDDVAIGEDQAIGGEAEARSGAAPGVLRAVRFDVRDGRSDRFDGVHDRLGICVEVGVHGADIGATTARRKGSPASPPWWGSRKKLTARAPRSP